MDPLNVDIVENLAREFFPDALTSSNSEQFEVHPGEFAARLPNAAGNIELVFFATGNGVIRVRDRELRFFTLGELRNSLGELRNT